MIESQDVFFSGYLDVFLKKVEKRCNTIVAVELCEAGWRHLNDDHGRCVAIFRVRKTDQGGESGYGEILH